MPDEPRRVVEWGAESRLVEELTAASKLHEVYRDKMPSELQVAELRRRMQAGVSLTTVKEAITEACNRHGHFNFGNMRNLNTAGNVFISNNLAFRLASNLAGCQNKG